ncbi:hypothetical protein C8Q74DRAFT_1374111 [Fomes fomentarius]|nr:hypothetical protein C8Q74DRAFT_1374111 [Fomes fomentarius]
MRDPVTLVELDYVFDELKSAASQVDSTTGIHSSSVHGLHQSPSLIPRDLKQALSSDPYRRVHSTSDVPRQQRGWYENEMERIPALRELPRELYDMIASLYALAGTISREAEAEAVRKEVKKKRSSFIVQQNEDVYGVEFGLCKH